MKLFVCYFYIQFENKFFSKFFCFLFLLNGRKKSKKKRKEKGNKDRSNVNRIKVAAYDANAIGSNIKSQQLLLLLQTLKLENYLMLSYQTQTQSPMHRCIYKCTYTSTYTFIFKEFQFFKCIVHAKSVVKTHTLTLTLTCIRTPSGCNS